MKKAAITNITVARPDRDKDRHWSKIEARSFNFSSELQRR
jgi:hypothetical protein